MTLNDFINELDKIGGGKVHGDKPFRVQFNEPVLAYKLTEIKVYDYAVYPHGVVLTLKRVISPDE